MWLWLFGHVAIRLVAMCLGGYLAMQPIWAINHQLQPLPRTKPHINPCFSTNPQSSSCWEAQRQDELQSSAMGKGRRTLLFNGTQVDSLERSAKRPASAIDQGTKWYNNTKRSHEPNRRFPTLPQKPYFEPARCVRTRFTQQRSTNQMRTYRLLAYMFSQHRL